MGSDGTFLKFLGGCVYIRGFNSGLQGVFVGEGMDGANLGNHLKFAL